MGVLSELFRVVGIILNMKMDLFGYDISFMNILAFVIISSICAIFLVKLINLFS